MELKELISLHVNQCEYCKTKNPNKCAYIKENHPEVHIRTHAPRRYQKKTFDSFKLSNGSTLKVQNGYN